MLNVPTQGFADPEPCVGEKGHQSNAAGAAITYGGGEHPTQLGPGQPGCLTTVTDLRPPHMFSRRRWAHFFVD
jgi:hypothetical protein